MKKTIFVLILIFQYWNAYPCDVCGCGVSGNYYGILPQFNKNFAGVRARYREYLSQHPVVVEEPQKLDSKEYFSNIEVWTRIFVTENLQLFAFVPFNNFVQKDELSSRQKSGIGDIVLSANYIAYQTHNDSIDGFRHLVQIGAGIKLPTGENDGSTSNQNFQIGTKSLDIPLNAIYTLRFNSFGLNTELGYSFNNTNNIGYKFGNRFTSAMRIFYWQDFAKMNVLPNIGISYENADYDLMNTFKVDYTGGDFFTINFGIETYWKNLALGINYIIPTYQNIASGQIQMNNKLMANITYLF
jgi:hypothetical protein